MKTRERGPTWTSKEKGCGPPVSRRGVRARSSNHTSSQVNSRLPIQYNFFSFTPTSPFEFCFAKRLREKMLRSIVYRRSLIGRVLAVLLAVLGSARLGVGIFAWRAANVLERPDYTVIRKLPGGVELRRYAAYTIAETAVKTSSMREASSTGFRTVAGYIFGKNKPSEKMRMTAPVRMSTSGGDGEAMAMTAPVRIAPSEGTTRISFVLEKKYSPQTAPAPLSRDVKVRKVQPHILAARTFSGPPPSEQRVEKEKQAILSAVKAAGLKPSASGDEGTLVYGYHDPFITPSWLRRNEVCVRVEDCEALRVRVAS